jgi:hypothetical protein
MRTRFSLLCALAVLVATGPGFAQSQVLVQGQPPLTEETVGRFTEFFEWAFDVQLTVEQRQVLRKYTVDSWTQKKTSDMNDVVQLVQQQTELSKLDAQQRGLVRLKIEPELLAQMRNQPNEPMAKWALAVYEASHQAIAPGAPPLTRQSTDAFLHGGRGIRSRERPRPETEGRLGEGAGHELPEDDGRAEAADRRDADAGGVAARRLARAVRRAEGAVPCAVGRAVEDDPADAGAGASGQPGNIRRRQAVRRGDDG